MVGQKLRPSIMLISAVPLKLNLKMTGGQSFLCKQIFVECKEKCVKGIKGTAAKNPINILKFCTYKHLPIVENG
jgi:hypothetical protein